MLTHFSCFTGIAGIDLAAEAADFTTVGQVEIADYPVKHVLERVWPDVPRWRDIRNVTEESLKEKGIKDVTVLSGGFPCFPAGTLVETRSGYREIETLSVGDEVRTHMGRFKKIYSVMKRESPVMRLRIRGTIPIEVTEEHPFFCRERTHRSLHSGRVYHFGDRKWVEAKNLTGMHYVGHPLNTDFICDAHTIDFWFLVGRWLGNGWIINTLRKSKVPQGCRGSRITSRRWVAVICDGYEDADDLEKQINSAGFKATRVEERTNVKFHICSMEFVKFLEPFSRGAANKQIPGFVFNLPLNLQEALFRGWIASDGYERESFIAGTTVSKKLALGMARISRTIFRSYSTTIKFSKVPETTVIEGRVVNQRPFYQLRIWKHPRKLQGMDDDICWSQVTNVEKTNEVKTVYNIAVEEDESYVAEECIVHNCQPFSTAGKRKGKGDDRYLWDELIRVIGCVKPTWFVGENVAGITSMEQPDCVAELEKEGSIKSLYERILPEIIKDLEEKGFLLPRNSNGTPIIFTIPACAVNAPHRRMRVFIVAYNADNARRNRNGSELHEASSGQEEQRLFEQTDFDVAYTKDNGRNGRASPERWEEQDRGEGREVGNQPCGQDTDVAKGGNASNSEGSRVGGLPIFQGEPREDNTNFVGEDCFASESENNRCEGGNPSGRRELPDRAGREETWDQPFGQDCDAPDLDGLRRNNGADRGEGIQRNETCDEAGTGNQPSEDVANTILSEASRFGGNSGDVYRIPEPEILSYGGAWEIPWPEVATTFCRVFNGFPDWLDSIGEGLIYEQSTITRQNLRILWEEIQQEEVWEEIRRCFKIPEKEILFEVMCAFAERANPSNDISISSKETQESIMREMWRTGPRRYAPQEWESERQQTRESSNSLSPLSYEIALATESLFWWYQISTTIANRVDRLKCLGNAVVPQQVYPIFKYIAEIEKGSQE